jgi:hypothetical protein
MLNETLSLEVKMKLTNKILIVAFVLVLAATTALAIKLTGVVKFTPQPMKNGFAEEIKYIAGVNKLEICGKYEVDLHKGDKDSINIWGPDLLVRKYSEVSVKNGKLTIKSKVNLSQYATGVWIRIYLKNLKELKVSEETAADVKNMAGDTLKIFASKTANVKFESSTYNESFINVYDNSIVSLEKTKNASVHLEKEAMLIINLDGGSCSGSQDPESLFIVNGKIWRHKVWVAEKTAPKFSEVKK